MKPIILLGIVAIGAIALGTGFLAPIIPNVTLQNLGVGDKDLETPINNAGVDLDIQAVLVDDGNGGALYKNKFFSCSFHSGDSPLSGPLDAVICKLTNSEGLAVGEGRINFCDDLNICPQGPYIPSKQYIIAPLSEAYPGALNLDNVNDVKIVVLGNNPVDNP